jgi:CBS domain-containing protein
MQLKDVMTKNVQLTDPGTTLKSAAALMRDGDFGLLPVGENDRLVGTLSDRDIVVAAVAEGKDPNSTAVRDAMSEGIAYCFEDQSVDEAAEVMRKRQIRSSIATSGRRHRGAGRPRGRKRVDQAGGAGALGRLARLISPSRPARSRARAGSGRRTPGRRRSARPR